MHPGAGATAAHITLQYSIFTPKTDQLTRSSSPPISPIKTRPQNQGFIPFPSLFLRNTLPAMLCCICNQNLAMVHITQTIEGISKRISICNQCALEKNVEHPTGLELVDLLDSIPDKLKVLVPEPEKFLKDGFAEIPGFISRLLNSKAKRVGLIISTLDGNVAILLSRYEYEYTIHLGIDWRQEPEREKTIREFFNGRRLPLVQDYLSGNGNVSDATRNLTYGVNSDASSLSALAKEVLTHIYGLSEEAGLKFRLE
jgi:hypothetical protein